MRERGWVRKAKVYSDTSFLGDSQIPIPMNHLKLRVREKDIWKGLLSSTSVLLGVIFEHSGVIAQDCHLATFSSLGHQVLWRSVNKNLTNMSVTFILLIANEWANRANRTAFDRANFLSFPTCEEEPRKTNKMTTTWDLYFSRKGVGVLLPSCPHPLSLGSQPNLVLSSRSISFLPQPYLKSKPQRTR